MTSFGEVSMFEVLSVDDRQLGGLVRLEISFGPDSAQISLTPEAALHLAEMLEAEAALAAPDNSPEAA